jgi:hypothetical protein
VLSQADILIAMKLTSSQDRDAIGGWNPGRGDSAQSLRGKLIDYRDTGMSNSSQGIASTAT